MKRNIVFITLFLVIFNACNFIENTNNNLEEKGLFGQVKSIETTKYVAVDKFGKISIGDLLEGSLKTISKFDKAGKIIEEISYEINGGVFHHCNYVYNEDGQSIEENITEKSSGRIIKNRITYKYLTSGKISEKSVYNSDNKLIEKVLNKYDNNDKIVQTSLYNNEGKTVQNNIIEYNNEGRKVILKEYDSLGTHLWTTRFSYSEYINEYFLSEEYRYSTGQNNDRAKATMIAYNYEGKIVSFSNYRYQKRGGRGSRNLISHTYYNYDDQGKLIKKTKEEPERYTSKNTLWTFDYEYDENNNWIKQIEYLNTVPHTVTERLIEYFDRLDEENRRETKSGSEIYRVQKNNGEFVGCYDYQYDNNIDNYLKINVGGGTDVALKLINKEDNKCIRYLYVKNNTAYKVKNIPHGKYYLKIAYGKEWIVKQNESVCQGKFGENPLFEKGIDVLDYNFINTSDGYKVRSYELSLDVITTMPENSFNSTNISAEEFYN